jgi:hypothetical protein
VVAAALGRRVWFPWDNGPLYTNLFTILVGKPGDRKTSATKSAAKLAAILLAPNAFLPTNVSAEALFDEYYELAGGRPDKFWVCHDAHVVLENWKKSSHGERVSAMFLLLFDCMELTESFLRTRKKDEKAKRIVEENSTSILFGATFRDAAFEGTQIKAGMARRFLYYAGAGHGRTLVLPEQIVFGKTADLFKPLLAFCGAMKLSDEAYKRWTDYQYENRRQMDELDINQEDLCARLNTSPTWVLKIAMIFEACVAVADSENEWHEISVLHGPRCILGSLFAWQARFDLPYVLAPTPTVAARLVELWAIYWAREKCHEANGLLRGYWRSAKARIPTADVADEPEPPEDTFT